MNSLKEELDEIRKTCFAPRGEQKIWEWARENCGLLSKSGAKLKRAKVVPQAITTI